VTDIQMQTLKRLQCEYERLLKRVEVLEAHVERLESDCLPAPDSYDCRPALPSLGGEQ
jgi:cell division protein FtsB